MLMLGSFVLRVMIARASVLIELPQLIPLIRNKLRGICGQALLNYECKSKRVSLKETSEFQVLYFDF